VCVSFPRERVFWYLVFAKQRVYTPQYRKNGRKREGNREIEKSKKEIKNGRNEKKNAKHTERERGKRKGEENTDIRKDKGKLRKGHE
jgi:hypothetical protein